ncbi:MAG: hypothetical protein SFV81_18255 [Pirellulaceae bacterium]|nr:hypothetical protein [Pirellulaceae bacterium]
MQLLFANIHHCIAYWLSFLFRITTNHTKKVTATADSGNIIPNFTN